MHPSNNLILNHAIRAVTPIVTALTFCIYLYFNGWLRKKLREIYIKAIIPPRIEGYQDYGMLTPVLIDVDTSILIHIPSGTKKLYQSAPGWSLFTNFVDDL